MFKLPMSVVTFRRQLEKFKKFRKKNEAETEMEVKFMAESENDP